MTATSTYRRKNDDLSSPIPDTPNYLDDQTHIPVFTSAIPSYSNVQRRTKQGSTDSRNAVGLGLQGQSTSDWTLFANGWKDDASTIDDNIWDNEPSASSSTSSFDPPRAGVGPSTRRSLNNGLMSSPSHPLSSPSRERWSHEESGSNAPIRPTSRRTNSDESYTRGIGRTWSRTYNGKGKGRMSDEQLEVIAHEVSKLYYFCPGSRIYSHL